MQILLPIIIFLLILVFVFLLFSKSPSQSKWKKDAEKKLTTLSKSSSSKDLIVLKATIVEYDKLTDFVFINKGVKGKTMGERLKNAKKLFKPTDYNDLWEAHKMRNKIAHELNYNPKLPDLKKSISVFRKNIKKLI